VHETAHFKQVLKIRLNQINGTLLPFREKKRVDDGFDERRARARCELKKRNKNKELIETRTVC